jgi:hypothetical protein
MDNILNEAKSINHNSFINHIFSTTEEGKAEILNVIQYSLYGILPVVLLNKTVQKFIPEADVEKSSLELLAEIFIQIVIMFVGIILIHRGITYFPTYSGFKYEQLNLTTVVLAFLVIVLSLQTKLGIKINILVDRAVEMWNGPGQESKDKMRKNKNPAVPNHSPSQADHADSHAIQTGMFPPPPAVTNGGHGNAGYDYMVKVSGSGAPSSGSDYSDMGPAPANGILGGAFGSKFW